MGWLSDIFARLSGKEQAPVKTFEERYNELGAFEYSDDGFTLKHKDFERQIRWDDFKQITVYKADLYTVDQINMEIYYGDVMMTINEELQGWYQFVLKTKQVFPSIPQDWDIQIINPAFEANYTTIYTRPA